MKSKNVVGTSLVTEKTGAETEKKFDLGAVPVDPIHSQVTVEMSFTKNLGNYQSARFAVTLAVPTNTDQVSLETAFTYARGWVEDKLGELVKEAEKTLG